MPDVVVHRGAAEDTYELRRVVLRNGDPTNLTFPEDGEATTIHLVAREDGDVVGIATLLPHPCPVAPGRSAVQLRGMAVAPDRQGSGIGQRVLDAAVEEVRAADVELLWANARDTALEFYERYGMTVYGEGFVTIDTGLPHHLVVLEVGRPTPAA